MTRPSPRKFSPVREFLKAVARCVVGFVLMAVALKVYGIVGIAVIALVAPVFALAAMTSARFDTSRRAPRPKARPARLCYQHGGWHRGFAR